MAVMKMFIHLGDPAYQSRPLYERVGGIAEALFRVFDANGNGLIELFEVNEILSDVISGVAGVLCVLIDHFEPYILKEPLDAITRIYGEQLRQVAGDEPFSVEKILEFTVRLDDPPPGTASPTEAMEQRLAEVVPGFQEKLAVARQQYDAFFAAFDRQATNGQLPKAKCVDIATGCVVQVFDQVLSIETFQAVSSEPVSSLDKALARPPLPSLKPASLDPGLVNEVAGSALGALRGHLKGGGLKRMLTAVFDLLDVNNDGLMSRAELSNLSDALIAAYTHGARPGLKDKVMAAARAALALIDSDTDGTLSLAELRTYAAKMIVFAFALVNLEINAIKQVVVGCLLPLLTALFSIKAQMMGGSSSGVTMADVWALIDKIEPRPLAVGAAVRLGPAASDYALQAGPLKSPEQVATLIEYDGTGQPYRVRTADGVEHGHWYGRFDLVAADSDY
jgi:hypothetical protein